MFTLIPNAKEVLTKAYSIYALGAAIGVQVLDLIPFINDYIPWWLTLVLLAWGFGSRFIAQPSVTNPAAAPIIAPVAAEPKYDSAV